MRSSTWTTRSAGWWKMSEREMRMMKGIIQKIPVWRMFRRMCWRPKPWPTLITSSQRNWVVGIEGPGGTGSRITAGQMNDALDRLRMALGEKSLLYRTEVRNSKSQRTSLRSWQNVNKQHLLARQHKRAYDHARNALTRLDIDRDYHSTLHDITLEDMKMSGDVTEENQMGQRSSVLAWFWRLDSDVAMEVVELNPRMKECGYFCG